MATKIPIKGSNKSFGEEVFFIAEIGKNFIQTLEERPVAEYLENAKKLVKAAKEAGADAVKFQTHEVEDEQLNLNIVSPHFKGADRYSWITRNMQATPIDTFWMPLKKYCDEIDILFFSTPMSRKAAYKLHEVGVPFWKVGSGDVQDYVTLDFMMSTKKPVIISSGMVSLQELDDVITHLRGNDTPLVVLYCISQYPAPKEYFNLGTIEYLTEKYPEVIIGFSDHSLGDEVALAAVKLGAKVVEKHFSFGRDLWGADHKVSMTPEEFSGMVTKVKKGEHAAVDAEAYYGAKDKELEGANNTFRPYFNKSLMAGANIPAGAVITRELVFAMRPKMYAKGLPAEEFPRILGRKVKIERKKFDPITDDIFE